MATIVVKTQVYSSSIGLMDTVEGICRRIEAKAGYKGVAGAVGSEFGIIPSFGSVTFRVYGVPNDTREAAKAEKAIGSETGLKTFGANSWKIVGSEFLSDVVVQTAVDAGQIVKDGAKGFGFGIGLGLLLLGAAYLFVLRGAKA